MRTALSSGTRLVARRKRSQPLRTAATKQAKKAERPAYAGVKITDDVCLVSYLSQSGYTLTVTLNFRDGTTVGVASNEKTWVPVKGTFEALG